MKRARFYCENCRKEVRWDAKVCPHCGRFFSAVKCPSCGFTGKSELFVVGCPSCGYAGSGAGASGQAGNNADLETYPLEAVVSDRPPRRRSHLPVWVYPAAIVTLLTALLVLVLVYVRMAG